jgi:methylated-DNA-[protein]-cysteine S-methyltransferase
MTETNMTQKILDDIFAQSPDETIIEQAQAKLAKAVETAKMNTIFFTSLQHELVGSIYLATRSKKLVAVDFGISQEAFFAHIDKTFGQAPYSDPTGLEPIAKQVKDYLNGERKNFEIPFDLSSLTNFQCQVLLATLQIPRGQIVTYGEIARRIGNPRSMRAVGQALGRNPIPIVIPCHRVIASNGSLGGYSGGGGLETKAKLLQLEGAQLFA